MNLSHLRDLRLRLMTAGIRILPRDDRSLLTATTAEVVEALTELLDACETTEGSVDPSELAAHIALAAEECYCRPDCDGSDAGEIAAYSQWQKETLAKAPKEPEKLSLQAFLSWTKCELE